MSFTRIAICSLTLVAAGAGCRDDQNDSQGEPYSRAVERGASDFDRSMAPTGTTASSNTRGGTSMTTDTPISGSQRATGAGTTGTGSIPPATDQTADQSTDQTAGKSAEQTTDRSTEQTTDRTGDQTTDQNREARRGVTNTKRSGTKATGTKDTGTKATDTKAMDTKTSGTKATDTGASSGDVKPSATNPSTNKRPEKR